MISRIKNGIKSRLTEYQKQRIKRVLDRIRYTIVRIVIKSKLLTTLYFYFRGTFYPEQHAILAGQIRNYEAVEKQSSEPFPDLIRGIHRIEKGLSMPDTRDVFAETYIEKTINCLETVYTERGEERALENQQVEWAFDVLDEYFTVVDSTPPIEAARDRFRQLQSEAEYGSDTKTPFERGDTPETEIDYDDLLTLSKRRCSTRWFEDTCVPREELDRALAVARESPSACNRQSFTFQFYDDDELIQAVCNLSIGVSGYKENIPCLAVITGRQRAYFNERDKHLIYIDSSLAAMGFQYSLEAQGLASCCINWPAIPENKRAIHKLLNLDDDEQVIMLMAIGYPADDGMVPYSEKRDLEDLRRFNEV